VPPDRLPARALAMINFLVVILRVSREANGRRRCFSDLPEQVKYGQCTQ